MSKDFKMPPLDKYDGSFDPNDHVDSFQSQMHLVGVDESCMCVAFSTTFKGVVRTWYRNLTPGSIKSWAQFMELFTSHFITSKKCSRFQESLLNVVQREGESIRSYIKRFNDTCLQIPNLDPTVRLTAAKKGITHREFKWHVVANKPKNITAFLKLTDQLIGTEEEMNPKTDNLAEKRKRDGDNTGNDSHKRRKSKSPSRGRNKSRSRSPLRSHKSGQRSRTPPVERTSYTPLNAKRGEILLAIKDSFFVKWPPKLRGDLATRNRNVYYHFHRDHGHSTENCRNLRDEIEELIRHGYLKNFIQREGRSQADCQPDR
ncbi:PREDICTED: uncharacterized protein LOC104593299 [Nelumbo nucifera]|uniref:Uncharacterized protein LOC104593299 n=1 Tax=Nelumbo nucifera TaxID=4432 RepID=A0A1U7ZCP3_NELNU|nr:PREDICTED: uncharacterized protein LOC104593299 [Nelumbo nucifera]